MITKERMLEVKEQLKKEAKEIASHKGEVKTTQRNGNYAGHKQCALLTKRYNWRHKFIAYCELKGRTLDEIEPNCREGNEPNLTLVERYRREFENDSE